MKKLLIIACLALAGCKSDYGHKVDACVSATDGIKSHDSADFIPTALQKECINRILEAERKARETVLDDYRHMPRL